MAKVSYNTLTPIKDHILVTDMHFDELKTKTGIIIRSDDGKTEGIKPRWCKVFAVGHSQKHVKVGDWLLIEHGRWTRAVTIEGSDGETNEIRRIDNTAIVLISDKKPEDVYFGESNKSNTHTFDFTKPMM